MSANAKPGDQCQALCEACKQQVGAIYQIRDLPISDGAGVAEGVLAIVCNECGAVCGFHNISLSTVQAEVMPNDETRAALDESVDVDRLERSSIKDLFK